MYKQNKTRVHFVGIGGIGMSGIAEILLSQNHSVTGSDLSASDTTEHLEKVGAKIAIGHSKENLHETDVVVISSAVKKDNPEVVEAKKLGIPIIKRAEMLGELMKMHTGIAIAGTHGKTTTTSMIASMLSDAELDPTVIIGGKVDSLGGNARLGKGEFVIAEADESDASFLHLPAAIAVVTNIDDDHLDHYGSIEEIRSAFLGFINKIPFYGQAILCSDDSDIKEMLSQVNKPKRTYGISSDADLRAKNISSENFCSSFDVLDGDTELGRITIQLPGEHMVLNALAAISVGIEIGVPFSKIKHGLEAFDGVRRRFQKKGTTRGILIFDDYAHHPTEVAATLKGIKENWEGRVVVLFQPHRYSRTQQCFEKFVSSFSQADCLLVTDIYPAGEDPIEGVSAELLAKSIHEEGHAAVKYVGDLGAAQKICAQELQEGDFFITMGAGPVFKVGEALLESDG